MIELERHISRLISKHDCVIVPGFGAFLAHYVPACYIVEEQVFIPPYRELGFNPEITFNDALLATFYMDFYHLKYDEAVSKLNSDVAKLKSLLSETGTLCFGELGMLNMNIHGKISFEPSQNGISDPNHFGMESITITQLHVNKDKTIVIPIKKNKIIHYAAIAAAIITMFIFVTPLNDTPTQRNIKASFANFVSTQQITQMQQLSAKTPITITPFSDCEITPLSIFNNRLITGCLDNFNSNDSLAINQVPTVENEEPEVVQTNNMQTEEAITENKETANQKRYSIIVASLPTIDLAEKAIKELSAKYQMNYTIVPSGGRYRISAGDFDDSVKAQNSLPTVQQSFVDAWVFTH